MNAARCLQSTFLVVLLWNQTSLGSAQSTQSVVMQSEYDQLVALSLQIIKKGADKRTTDELRHARDYFKAQGNVGAKFLIARLNAINAAERAYLGPTPNAGSVGFWIDSNLSAPRSYICLILADMFEQLTPDTRAAVLDSLKASYTPSEDFKESIQYLNLALWRIGPPAMPAILSLADNPRQFVRCSITGNLHDLREHFIDQAKGRILARTFPQIDCGAHARKRRAQLKVWETAWKSYGGTLKFPPIPSFFELDENPEN